MNRGDVWTVAGGTGYTGKPRPSVLVQSDQFAETLSVTVAAFTSDISDVSIIRPLVAPDGSNGLREPSYLMVDKLMTVPRSRLGSFVGRLSDTDVLALNRALATFLGLTGVAASQRDAQ